MAAPEPVPLEPVEGQISTEEEEKLLHERYESSWSPGFMLSGDKKVKWGTRLSLIGIAVGLLWLTSLAVSSSLASIYVSVPAYPDTVDKWFAVTALAYSESDLSLQCIDRQVDACYWELGERFQELLMRYNVSVAENKQAVALEQQRVAFCSGRRVNSIEALGKYLETRVDSVDIYNSYCTADQVNQLKTLIGDKSAQKSVIYSQNAQYASTSKGYMANAAESARNRSDYDYNYWLADPNGKFHALGAALDKIKLKGLPYPAAFGAIFGPIYTGLVNMAACLSFQDGDVCTITPNAFTLYRTMKDAINDSINTFRAWALETYASVVAFQIAVDDYVRQVNDLFGALSSFASAINSLQIPGFSFSLIPNPPTISPPLQAPPGLDNVPDPLDLDWSQLQRFKTDFNATIRGAQVNVNLTMYNMWSDFNVSIDPIRCFVFCDYNPPPITVKSDEHAQESDAFLAQSASSLGQLEFTDTQLDLNATANATRSALAASFSSFSFPAFFLATFTWKIDFYDWLSAIGDFSYLLIVADIVFRVFSTVITIIRYLGMSDLGLPLIDIRGYTAKKEGPKVNAWTMYKAATHPGLVALIILCFIFAALMALIGVYIPYYHDFQNGCVQSSNGTMITKNAYAFAYNFASSDFNREAPRRLGRYDQQRSEYCAQYSQASVQLQTEYQTQLDEYRSQYDTMSAEMALFDLCINYTSPDFPTPAELPNYTYPFDAPGRVEWDARLDCGVPENYGSSGLSNAVFDCSLLPMCNLTCSGPDAVAIRAATHDSGCQSEYMVHAGIFRFALALLVFVCLNISRFLIMAALIRLCWRALSEKGFEYIGNCNRLGYMTPESQVLLKEKTDTVIRRFEGVAFLMLFFAVLFHIPYIVVLSQYGDTFASDKPQN